MIGRTVSHYTIEAQRGEGGMGAVYLARDTTLGRRVAIKVISPALLGDPANAARLLREARAASRLNHPNIVTVHEIDQADGLDFIIMEFVDGRSLASEIEPGGMPIERAIDLARQMARGLAAAHAAGIVHRDLKPANVMLTADGRAKLLDFGLAKIVTPSDAGSSAPTIGETSLARTAAGAVIGTVGYLSPEQIEGHPADARSDVFALGVTMFEILTGRRPHGGATDWAALAATLHADAPSVASLRADVPPELARIVARCLARSPGQRYPSAIAVSEDLERLAASRSAAPVARVRALRGIVLGAGALAVVAIAVIVGAIVRESRLRWAQETAIDEINRRLGQDDIAGAYDVGRRALAIAPADTRVQQAWHDRTVAKRVDSEPSGAELAFTNYLPPHGPWIVLGRTPLPAVPLPRGFVRWRLTKPGYDTLEVGTGVDRIEFRLVPKGTARPGMVLVPKGDFDLETTNEAVTIPDFWLDRFEVTNRRFKAFVDSGGYRRREFWKEPFVKNGHTIPWEQAIAGFTDGTGRPGPSTWELGSYPEGQGDAPVAGVSWYEASAYAVFAGKQLPTAYHWYRASGAFSIFSDIIRASNFSGRAPIAVGSSGGLGPYGTYDMAGNVKEWCANGAQAGRRYILGGSFGEAAYMFRDQDAQSPFDRGPTFGFRCMWQQEPVAPRLAATIPSLERDPATLKPVGPDVFAAYRRLYDYDPTPLEARVEATDDADPAWHKEIVSVRAAYGDERLPIHVFVPRSSKPPYQAVVYFPGSDAVNSRASQNLSLALASYLVRSGRVLVYPIYQQMYERRLPGAVGQNQLREIMIDRGKDLRRAVDYVVSRGDIDTTRIAYYGLSLGAQFGPWALAIEPRFRAGVLFSGGFEVWAMPPEADPVNFAPHVTTPVLMVNGREDFDLPYATAQVPMFRMLATPVADKQHVVLEGGHIPSHPQQAIKAVLDWLDRRMGPVR